MKSKLEEVLKEQKFPCIGIDSNDRDSYLEIVKNCKDICESNQKVDGQSNCRLIEMHLYKDSNEVNANGSVIIGTEEKREYRHVDANIYIESESIIVDMLVTRLQVQDERQQYRTLDEFTIEDDKLIRRSQYNYDMKSMISEVNNDAAAIIIELIKKENKKGRKK